MGMDTTAWKCNSIKLHFQTSQQILGINFNNAFNAPEYSYQVISYSN